MSYLKRNQLQIEAKVASDVDPKTKFWGYYTKDEVRRLSAMARRYHITLVPEINSPGHIDPYLENHPELQLTDASGAKSPTRLDITKPEAFAFYTRLVDEALSVWDTPYWHMGADEYMLGSDFANYPQIAAYAKAKYGDGATPQDAFVDFVNRVDAHVRAGGRTLRSWNDGLNGQNTVPVNKDVVIGHWLTETGAQPSDLLAAGNPVMNSAYSLYLVRGGFHWTPRNSTRAAGLRSRLRARRWRATSPASPARRSRSGRTRRRPRRRTRSRTTRSCRCASIAQATWGSPEPAADYAGFSALAQDVGNAPGWLNVTRLPLADGTYALTPRGSDKRLTTGSADDGAPARFASDPAAAWKLTATADGYYQVRAVRDGAVTQECLDVVDGTHYLGAPLEVGAAVTRQPCDEGTRTQRWQAVARDVTFHLVNAISQLVLAEGTGGAAVQMAPDVQRAVQFTGVGG